jgi:hypothetical protein
MGNAECCYKKTHTHVLEEPDVREMLKLSAELDNVDGLYLSM